ncbi:DRG2 [Hepatospora eriocheir]|uniref:DRG2 n=1 Tax=Hepatospora eriocheir TaxID=1081669 RepID=A0A1X0QKD1_9MICR|nr:DRG2 [Hepatospora eriocheir]
MMLDYNRPHDKDVLTRELYKMGIRLNRKRPDVTLTMTGKNINGRGLAISSTVRLTKITEETIQGILKTYKIYNCQLTIREDITVDDLIDVLSGNVSYVPCVYVYNKVDELTMDELRSLPKEASLISCSKKWNIEGFKDEIWKLLYFTRIYTKKKGEDPDFKEPVILKNAPTVKDLCRVIHKTFYLKFKFAFVWGRSVKHNPQKVGLNHILQDEDVIQVFSNR